MRRETVWRFLVDERRLAEWWGGADVDPRPGGRFVIRMREGPEPVMRGQIVELSPPDRLLVAFGWEPGPGMPALPPGASRLEIVLQRDGPGTALRLRHSGLPDALIGETRAGWDDFLPRLAAAATQHDSR